MEERKGGRKICSSIKSPINLCTKKKTVYVIELVNFQWVGGKAQNIRKSQ